MNIPTSGSTPSLQIEELVQSREMTSEQPKENTSKSSEDSQQSISTEIGDTSVSMQANHNASVLGHLTSTKLHREIDQQQSVAKAQESETISVNPNALRLASAEEFHQAITNAKAGKTVYIYPVEEYAEMTMLLSNAGSFGVAIKKDGDIVSVFKSTVSEVPKGVTDILIPEALKNGGRRLDCFNMPNLPLPLMYAKHGLVPVAKVAFDPKEKPDGWEEKDGTPDVIFMAYNPAKPYPTDTRERLPLINADINKLEAVDYGSAIKIQEEKVEEFNSKN
ncbi:hypothetical protein [Candidatus Protochlamydia amoebophila]|uniref:Uncharacterized protein n=1 Tax=Protochlamydia amoebophila (strain UWE25) TaxID=264201 RepID=Q6MAD0_PARUW|nr:hypothetical protein [Candidatus Protochlamydia amoebophila]CAF24469.1 unnamed protein product [Candidatus Protochlamydia amoebophila UWE25]